MLNPKKIPLVTGGNRFPAWLEKNNGEYCSDLTAATAIFGQKYMELHSIFDKEEGRKHA
jgi:hypothetical protein